MLRVANPKARPLAGEAAFSCLQCGAKFTSLQALGGHKSVHSGKRRAQKNHPQPAAPQTPPASASGFSTPGFPQFFDKEEVDPYAKRQRTAHGWVGHGTPPPQAQAQALAQSPAEAMAVRQMAVRLELQRLMMASGHRSTGANDASAGCLTSQPWLHQNLVPSSSLVHHQHAAAAQAGVHSALLESTLFPPFGASCAPPELVLSHPRSCFPTSVPAHKARSMSPWATPALNQASAPSLSPLSRTSRMQPAGLSTASLSPKSSSHRSAHGVPAFSPYFASSFLADVSTTVPSLATASGASGPTAHPAHAAEPASACATSPPRDSNNTTHPLCASDNSASFLEAAAKKLVSLGARQPRATGHGLSSMHAASTHGQPEPGRSSRHDLSEKGISTSLELCSRQPTPPAHPLLQLGLGSLGADADADGGAESGGDAHTCSGEATCGSSNREGSPRSREGSLLHMGLRTGPSHSGHAHAQEQVLRTEVSPAGSETVSCRKALLKVKVAGGAGSPSPLDLTLSLKLPE